MVGAAGVAQDSDEQRRCIRVPEDFVRAGLTACEACGGKAPTARQVARRMGLSPMALYRHFDSMEHLQALVWNEAFVNLQKQIIEAIARSGGGLENLRQTLRAYVEFGAANPGCYHFMFSPGPRPEEFGAENEGTATHQFMTGQIKALIDAGYLPEDADPAWCALFGWLSIHGMTTLIVSGSIARLTGLSMEALIESVTNSIMRGIQARE